MILIKINRKLFTAALIIILTLLVGFNVLGHVQNAKTAKRFEQAVYNASEAGKGEVVAFLFHRQNDIEIFDISKGQVVKKVKPTPDIRKETEGFLNNISGLYTKVIAIPNKGYIIRIPLEPPAKVQNQWLKDYDLTTVDEAFIIFPEDEKPYLLVLDSKNRPFFFNFEGDTDALLASLDFNLNASLNMSEMYNDIIP